MIGLLENAIVGLLEEKGYLVGLDTIVSIVRSVSKLHKRVDEYLARRWSRAGQTSWTSQARECEEVSRRALREKEETISARNRDLNRFASREGEGVMVAQKLWSRVYLGT